MNEISGYEELHTQDEYEYENSSNETYEDVYTPYEYTDGHIRFYIMQDQISESPRTFFSNLGTLVIFNRNHRHLSDVHNFNDAGQFNRYLWETYRSGLLAYPVYIYRGYDCQIDLGRRIQGSLRVNMFDESDDWYFVTHEALRKEYGVKRISYRIRELASKILFSEIKTFNYWLSGNVYGWVLEKDGETLDSCWGFYGEDIRSQVLDTVPKKYYEIVKHALASCVAN